MKLTRSDIRHCLFYLRKHEGIISYLDGDGEETYGTK